MVAALRDAPAYQVSSGQMMTGLQAAVQPALPAVTSGNTDMPAAV
jgi:hypothetical protein